MGAFPKSFQDDGQTLYLDVHGCSVEDAMKLVQRALQEGARVGRARLEVIHGYSTSHSPDDRTIRNALSAAWEEGAYRAWVADVRWDEVGGRCTLWFKVGLGRSGGRLGVSDITR